MYMVVISHKPYIICMVVISGVCTEQLSKKDPVRLFHSRWLTTANRILRYYVSVENPSEELLMLATYIVKVYAPMWFCIKLNSLIVQKILINLLN